MKAQQLLIPRYKTLAGNTLAFKSSLNAKYERNGRRL